MKKRLIAGMMLCALAAAACEDDKCGSVNVYVNGQEGQNKSATDAGRLTVKEICKLEELRLNGATYYIENGDTTASFCTYYFTVEDLDARKDIGWIDTAKCRLRFRPTIIKYFEDDRENHCFFNGQKNFVIEEARGHLSYETGTREDCIPTYDTVAYIPTAQRMAVVDELLVLFDDKEKNWDRICELFNDAFVFIPCTGKEFRELEEAGLN